ncbi:ATP-binding protein [Streptomyces piniterrae]|nr:ATP-binding protein [Streptomyces piniterrae]
MYCSERPRHLGTVDSTTTWHLTANDISAGVARRHVRSFVRERRCDALAEDCALITSELVANAVRHGAGPVRLTLRHVVHDDGSEAVQLFVGDHGTGGACLPPRFRERSGTSLGVSGRGLTIVDALATTWGSTRIAGAHVMWATLRVDDRPYAPTPAGRRPRRPARRT